MFGFGHRYTEQDFHVGMTRTEAKAKGLTRKRSGTLRMYFDKGVLMEAYSYNTCIMTRMAPCEDFPYGRMVLNETSYGTTSSKHMSQVIRSIGSWSNYFDRNNQWREGAYERAKNGEEHFYIENTDFTHRAILIDVPMGYEAADLRDSVRFLQRTAASERSVMRERRIERIARIKEYNRSVDDYNAKHNYPNVILFRGSK